MKRIISIGCFVLLFTFSSHGQSINLVLPENLMIDSILPEWKGYNHGGGVSISEIQTPDFINAFSNVLSPLAVTLS